LRNPESKNIELVEIDGTLLRNLKKMEFYSEILSNPRLSIIIDDARRYLYRNKRKYDLIVMDPISTMRAYSNNVYSKEFITLLKYHLRADGILGIWSDNHDIMPKTMVSVFPRVKYFYVYFVASQNRLIFNEKRNEKYFHSLLTEEEKILITSKKIKAATKYIGDEKYIMKNFKNITINTDYRPRMEYYIIRLFKKLFIEMKN